MDLRALVLYHCTAELDLCSFSINFTYSQQIHYFFHHKPPCSCSTNSPSKRTAAFAISARNSRET